MIYPLANEVQQAAGRTRALFDGIHFPVRAADVPGTIEFVESEPSPWRIGSATIRRIALNHPGGAQGFRIDDEGGASLAYLTDNELSPPVTPGAAPGTSLDALAKFAEGASVVIHDAQYVETDLPAKRGWGHSTIDDVLRLGKKAATPHLVLFHHDPERDDDAIDGVVERASGWLAENAPTTLATAARRGSCSIYDLARGEPRRSSRAPSRRTLPLRPSLAATTRAEEQRARYELRVARWAGGKTDEATSAVRKTEEERRAISAMSIRSSSSGGGGRRRRLPGGEAAASRRRRRRRRRR